MSPREGRFDDRLADYVDVAERIREFRERYPNGRLRPASPAEPYSIEVVDGRTFVVYAAAAYRDVEDPLPGIGVAWEPVPGSTPYTRDSELQNAETAAWGRAIVAALVADTKRGIASRDEVAARRPVQAAPRDGASRSAARVAKLRARAIALDAMNVDVSEIRATAGLPTIARSTVAQLDVWERLIVEAETALTAPFTDTDATASTHGEVVDVAAPVLTTEVLPCEQDSELDSSSRSSQRLPSSSPPSDSPNATESETTERELDQAARRSSRG